MRMNRLMMTALFILAGVIGIKAQNIQPCATSEKYLEYYNALSPVEQLALDQNNMMYEAEIQNYVDAHPDLKSNIHDKTIEYTIPVVFHVIHAGGAENISYDQILDAVYHMNLDYQKSNSDWQDVVSDFLPLVADVQIEFKLAKLDPQGNCFNGVTRTFSTETFNGEADRVSIVQAEHGNWPGNKYLNIFVAANIGGAAGYTYKPNTWLGSSMANGIHVLDTYTGSIGTSSPNAQHTLSHEVGHWLNLDHTWGGTNEPGLASNCNTDDGVEDTPLCIGVTTCVLGSNSCNDIGSSVSSWNYDVVDNIENFMEYSYCSKMFTLGQKARVHAAINSSVGGRNNIWTAANLAATGVNMPAVLCKANFQADAFEVCPGEVVSFDDLSYDNVTSWSWEFEGGTPATSTDENPTVTYNQPGEYQVKLTVSDGTNFVSTTKNEYIKVLNFGSSLPFSEDFESVTSLEEGFWKINNVDGNQKFFLTNNVGYESATAVKLFNFGQASGSVDELISNPIDLSTVTEEDDLTFSFKYSYRKRSSGNNENIKIYFSTDCGQTWNLRGYLGGNDLGNEISSSAWTPSSAEDWKTYVYDGLTSNYWVSGLRIKIVFTSDGGNNLYLDNINITTDGSLGLDEDVNTIQNFNIYPNPTNDIANVAFYLQHKENITLELVNMMGQTISSQNIKTVQGKNLVTIPTEGIENGIYLVRISSASTQVVKRLIVE